jgi:DNA ligase D-like protein (predicted ligase)
MLPKTLKPMLASLADPFDSPGFTYEIKWDGYRCLAFLTTETSLQSRNQKDISYIFPELLGIHKQIKQSGCILDGEIIALRNNKPSFMQLQQRAQLRKEEHIKAAVSMIPIVYVVFDLLYLNELSILNEPIEKRRLLLAENISNTDELILATSIEKNGISYFNAISQLELEGVIAKQKGSPYLPGKRTKTWFKFKRKKLGNFIICGYSLNPAICGQLSSLILGAYYLNQLKLFGMVGTGFSASELDFIKKELGKIATTICPFTGAALRQKNVTWTRPLVVCEVEYLELTDDGSLRHPSFKRFRPDFTPADCIFEV